MISPDLNPQATYNFFQYSAGAFLLVGMFWKLRGELPMSQRVLLIFCMLAPIQPLAQLVANIAAHSQGQSYTGALLAQILGIAMFLFCAPATRVAPNLRVKIWNSFAALTGIAYALLRVGCHFRGCCWGTICGFPWAHYYRRLDVVTPQVHLPLHPVQLYSALHGILLSLAIGFMIKRHPERNALGAMLMLMGSGRLVTDWFRADAKYFAQSLAGFEPNTLLSVAVIILGITVHVATGRRSRRV